MSENKLQKLYEQKTELSNRLKILEQKKIVIDQIMQLSKNKEANKEQINQKIKYLKSLDSKTTLKEITDNFDQNEKKITDEINKLSEDDKQEIKKEFKNKSPKQIRKEIKTTKNPKIQKIISKIGKTMAIVGFLVLLGYYAGPYAISRINSFKKEKDKIEKIENDKKIKEIPKDLDIVTVDDLQQNISPDKIESGLSYEQIASTINNIKNKQVKSIVVNLINNGDIIGVQQYLGMNKHSQYQSNKATGKIDHRTLSRLSDPMFGLQGEDFLKYPNINPEVKKAYKQFLNGEVSNNDLDYVIISKPECKIYLFTKDHRLLNIQTVLLGKIKGESEHIGKGINPSTPTGFYRIEHNDRKNDGSTVVYIAGEMIDGVYNTESGQTYLLDLLPIDPQTGKYNYAYDITRGVIAIHATPQALVEARKGIFQSPDLSDNRTTGGCIDASTYSIIYDNTSAGKYGSIVYITSEKGATKKGVKKNKAKKGFKAKKH
ncbi:MAG: L,D-transpeptidase family protein [Candidatus Absconditabacterales bacterium]